MARKVPGWLAETAYITVAAGVGLPIAGRLMQTQAWQKAEQIPLAGIPLRGVRAWWGQLFNP